MLSNVILLIVIELFVIFTLKSWVNYEVYVYIGENYEIFYKAGKPATYWYNPVFKSETLTWFENKFEV